MATTLHLMTQRDQPYGSVRKCCEMCGLMMVARPDSFWRSHTWTDEPDQFKHWPADTANVPDELVPCTVAARSKTPNDKGKRTPEARSAVGGPLDPPVGRLPPEAKGLKQ